MSATTIPTVGTLASESIGSDCYPRIVTAVSASGKQIEVSKVDFILAPGFSAYHDWASANAGEMIIGGSVANTGEAYSLRKNGCWVKVGQPINSGCSISLGDARYHLDPSF